MHDTLSDSELVERINVPEAREETCRHIYKLYSNRLYFAIRRLVLNHDDANDILQDTFEKAFKNISQYRGESSLYTWFFRIAVNQTLTFLNKKNQTYSFAVSTYEEAATENLPADEYFDGDDLQLKLQKAIAELPVKQRIVFNMKYFDEMKYEEMAKVLETSVGALKASYHHAVTKIKNYFDEN